MRIIGGRLGGHRLKVKIPENVRPTTEKIRESIFNILNNLIDFQNIRVLDLFSGTGAFGFESISRGAAFVQYVEKNRKTCQIIENIAKELKVASSDYNISNSDAIKFIKDNKNFIDEKYHLVFADPPYDAGLYDLLVKEIASGEIYHDDCIFLVEYRTGKGPENTNSFNIIREKSFGDTTFVFLEKVKSN